MTVEAPTTQPDYTQALTEYLRSRSEAALYQASLLSQTLIANRLGPEEIVGLHMEAVEQVTRSFSLRERVRAGADALQFLLEVMIAYGVQYKEFTELKLTEQSRELEEERRRAEEAQLSEREQADLLVLIAHELRTPMTAVQGNVDLALRWLATGRAERAPRLLVTARDAIRRLGRLTDDLMLASQSDGQARPHEPLDLARVVAETCEWAGPPAEGKDLALHCELLSEPVPVLGDANALQTVVSNLLSNATRYTPAGGSITVHCGADGEEAFVIVRDTGIGMRAEVQSHVFEKFFRAPEARAVEERGLGLGLSLVQRIVRAHRGRIQVTSQEGVGSTFTILLPLVDLDQRAQAVLGN